MMPTPSTRAQRKVRAEVLRADPECACGRSSTEFGHIIPAAVGGIYHRLNGRGQCPDCNRRQLSADLRAGGSVVLALLQGRDVDPDDAIEYGALAESVADRLDVLLGREDPPGEPNGSSSAPPDPGWSPSAAVIRLRPRW